MKKIYIISILFVFFAAFMSAEDGKFDCRPDPAPSRWVGLIGKYRNAKSHFLILEDRGQLFLLTDRRLLLKEIDENTFLLPLSNDFFAEKIVFARSASLAIKCEIASVAYNRVLTGPESGKTFKIDPVAPIEVLRKQALAAKPPELAGHFLLPDLVNLSTLDPAIKFDIRYATDNNFMGTPFYRSPKAFLQRPAAKALLRVHKNAHAWGYGIMVFDAYRPWYVTKVFWDATPRDKKDFVADPSRGSRHNRGAAADVTLYDLKTGKPVSMPSDYDEFFESAYVEYPGGTSLQRWHAKLLRHLMEREGFLCYAYEWWHFDYKNWQNYPIVNLTFDELSK